jgi:hypothetical protein
MSFTDRLNTADTPPQGRSVRPFQVFTNCTTRKAPGRKVSFPAPKRDESLEELAHRWKQLLRQAPAKHVAQDLYAGRSFLEARRVANRLSAGLCVVSAGLGLIDATSRVPNYNATVTLGSRLAAALRAGSHSSGAWWRLIEPTFPLARFLPLHPKHHCYLALPATYLALLEYDLARIEEPGRRRLRIFTSPAGRTKLPEQLRDRVLPYDDRLEALEGFDGTRAEFPQRAMRHFVEVLNGHLLDDSQAFPAVQSAMNTLERPAPPVRRRMTDSQIKQVIRSQWSRHDGHSSRLLRYLRDDAHISCEQGRFARIWRSLHEARVPR